MGVLVCFDDFSYDVVSDFQLQELVEKGFIIGYDNSGDWIKSHPLPQITPSPKKAKGGRGSCRKNKSG